MNYRGIHRFLLICLCLTGLLMMAAPAVHAAPPEGQREEKVLQIETMFEELLGSSDLTPTFAEHGNGFYSLSASLEPEARERLLEAFNSGVPTDKATTFFVLSVGQQLTNPSNPATCLHAALSNVNAAYNYWVVVLNLGNQSLARTTTVKLNGPGRKFNKSIVANYPSGSIQVVWYNPGVGVGQPGIYTFTGSVSGAGQSVTKSFETQP
jgi:hypothetical protein